MTRRRRTTTPVASCTRSRRKAALVIAVSVGCVAVGGAWPADAQLPPISSGSTTTTSARPGSTTTTRPAASSTTLPIIPGSTTSTTTTTPSGDVTPPSAGPSNDAGEPLPPGAGDGTAPPGEAGRFPPELRQQMEAVVRSGSNSTRPLLDALEPLSRFGLDPTVRAVVGFGRFPVAGDAVWSHDWLFPRFGPGWRLHEGLDIFAAYGTPVRAPVDGLVRLSTGGLGGQAVYIVQPDRTYWYLAHLSALAPGLIDGATVTTGQVVGYVGDSGNAAGGKAHTHLEIHPQGGAPIDPKDIADRFVADAIAAAPALIAAYEQAAATSRPQQASKTAVKDARTLSARSTLLWVSAMNPLGGPLRLAISEAEDAMRRMASARAPADGGASSVLERTDEELIERWLTPLVPSQLASAIGWVPRRTDRRGQPELSSQWPPRARCFSSPGSRSSSAACCC